MFHLIKQTIFHQKKKSILYFLIFVLVFMLLFTIIPLFGTVIDNMKEIAAQKYGLHDSILYGLTEEQMASVKSNVLVRQSGTVTNYGGWRVADAEAMLTLGWFDAEAMALGNLRLLEGRLPEKAGEIALERTTIYRFAEQVAVGDIISLTQNNVTKEFKLVGFISNYTGNWSAPSDIPIEQGFNDLPQGWIMQEDSMNTPRFSMLLLSDGLPTVALQYAGRWNLSMSYNDGYYNFFINGDLVSLLLFQKIFYSIVMLASMFIIYIGVSLYISQNTSFYLTLYELGAEGEYPFIFFLLQQAAYLLLVLPAGMLLAMLFSKISTYILRTEISIFQRDAFIFTGIILLFSMGMLFIQYKRMIHSLRGVSRSEKRQEKKLRQMKIKTTLAAALTKENVIINWKRILPVLLLVAVLLSLFVFANVYFRSSLYLYIEDSEEAPFIDYMLSSFQSKSEFEFGAFSLSMDKERAFEKRVFEGLYEMEGIRYIDASLYGTKNATLVIPENQDAYWDMKSVEGSSLTYFTAEGIPGLPKNAATLNWMNYGIFVLNDFNKALLLENYPELAEKTNLAYNEVLCFFEPIGTRNNAHFKTGMPLELGRLAYDGVFRNAPYDKENIRYEAYDFKVGAVVDKPFQLTTKGGMQTRKWHTMLVISEQTYLENPFFYGVESAEVYLNKDISEEQYAVIDAYIGEIGASTVGGSIYSLQQEMEREKALVRIINIALSVVLVILGGFVAIILFIVLYMTLLQRQRSLGIMRALGMRKRILFSALFWEIAFYILLVVIFSLFIFFIGMQVLYEGTLSMTIQPQDIARMLRIVSVSIVIGLLLGVALIFILLRDLYKNSINTAIRYGK
jgi:putative ABC transport system permease protein